VSKNKFDLDENIEPLDLVVKECTSNLAVYKVITNDRFANRQTDKWNEVAVYSISQVLLLQNV